MQMVIKTVIILFFLWFSLLAFMPKTEFYHTLEKILSKEGIKLNEVSIEEGFFSLTIKDITVYFKGIAVANIERINVHTMLFLTSISIDNIIIDETLHKQIPAKTKSIQASYSFLSPLQVSVDANGSFGTLLGAYEIKEKKIALEFVETKDISMLKSMLHKDEKGWSYEKSF
jgi:hypothetical protein